MSSMVARLDKRDSALFSDSLRNGDVRFMFVGDDGGEGSFTVLSSLNVLRVNAQFFARTSPAFRNNSAEVDLNQLCMDQRFPPTEASLKLALALIFGMDPGSAWATPPDAALPAAPGEDGPMQTPCSRMDHMHCEGLLLVE